MFKQKLRTYAFFKHDLQVEPYILSQISRAKSSIYSQFRMGILPLEVEAGRYMRKELSQRTCKLCNLEVDDEIHFLCFCPTLIQTRQLYLNLLNLDANTPPLDLFISILQHQEFHYVINLVFSLWNERKLKLLN